MPIDFPTSPSNGQIFVANTKTWYYTGKGWKGYLPSGTIQTVITNDVRSPTVNAGQTIFSTPTYPIGQNILKVFLNGVRQNNIIDYVETTTSSITLTSAAVAGDVIVFEVPGYIDRPTTANSLTIINDTLTNTTRYPLFATSTSGILASTYTSDTKYTYNPSTGTLNSTNFYASSNISCDGIFISNTSGGIGSISSRFTINTSSKTDFHITSTINGTNANTTQQYGLTFAPAGGSTQAAVIISENGADGTAIGLFNTNNYATGPQLRAFIDPNGHLQPGVTSSYDLGSTSLRWRNIYTNDLQLSNGIGDYTIVEGEEDLFLYNNKSGKTYKFALIEVDPSVVPPKAKQD